MARPRVFVSSTYYDLKHVRASLDLFIDSLGFDPVLSEKGDIAYAPDRPLDESCYREAETADIFVLLVGGRYGSEASGPDRKTPLTFFQRYESITKKEYESASARDIPIYILVEKGVHSEYQTFLRNKSNTDIKYAHVDSVNVFVLLDEILSRPRNNPVHTFEKLEDIQGWLREQWAGLFRELLRRQSQQQQLAGLTLQIAELKEVNETLKTYLEAVMKGAGREETSKLIASEEQRLEEVRRQEQLRANPFARYAEKDLQLPFDVFYRAVATSNNLDEFLRAVTGGVSHRDASASIRSTLRASRHARHDLNEARAVVGMPHFFSSEDPEDSFLDTLFPEAAVFSEPIATDQSDDVPNLLGSAPSSRKRVGRGKKD